MKKQNESPKSAKFSRSSYPDQGGKSSSRSSSERPSRPEGPRARISKAGQGPFKPKKKITEKLFNKPTLKKSNLKKLAFDSSKGRNPFSDEGSPRPAGENSSFDRPKAGPRPRREPGDVRPPRRSDARRDDSRRDDARPKGGFRPRREEGDVHLPHKSDRDERGPRRSDTRPSDARRNDARRNDARPKGEFRPRREDGPSERPTRRFDKDVRNPRPDDRRPDRRSSATPDDKENKPGDGENRRVGRFSKPPRYDFSDYVDKKSRVKKQTDDDVLRLNRYIANAGICSRREADALIESGQISVNGKVVTEMGYKVKRSDMVKYGKDILDPERMVYLLINKPKDYITTTDDPEERKTVMDLVAGACEERIYPVGRLDRNTTGLLLLTNDGELAEKLTHPSGNIRKIYQAELDRPITTEDFEAMQKGFELEDGFIKPDDIGIVTPDAMVVGLEIHSGKNRIVRRMFENFGYEVKKLDRTVFAGLNKKELPRGKWRFLTEKEVVKLKFLL